MAKQAKLQLVADVKDFKQSIKEAREMLGNLGNVDIQNGGIKKVQQALEQDLTNASKKVEQEMRGILAVMTKLGSKKIVDTNTVRGYSQRLTELRKELKAIKEAQEDVKKSAPSSRDVVTGGGISGRGLQRGIGRGLGALGLGVGVAGALTKARRDSEEKLRLRALTGGTGVPEELEGLGLQYGFSDENMRRKQEQLARSLGRNVTSQEMESALTPMMQAERAFGVEADTSAQTISAARKAGVRDEAKYLSNAIGVAVAAQLEGGRISEFLQASNSYLEQMSQGINIDARSLNGFAGALSTIPFFAQDPNRAFNMLKSMNQMFQSGDPYQRTLASRAVIQATGGRPESLGAVEFRRQMGLFGEIDEDTKARLMGTGKYEGRGVRGGKQLMKTLGVGGADIIKNIFDDIMSSTDPMVAGNRLFAFQQATRMDAGAAAPMFARLSMGESITQKDIDKFKEAMMTPTERLNKTFTGVESSISTFVSKLENISEDISKDIAEPIANLGNKIPLNTKELARVAEALIGLSVVMGLGVTSNILGKAMDIFKGKGKIPPIPKALKGGPPPIPKKKGMFGKAMSRIGGGVGRVARFAGGALGVLSALESPSLGAPEGSLVDRFEKMDPTLTPEEIAEVTKSNVKYGGELSPYKDSMKYKLGEGSTVDSGKSSTIDSGKGSSEVGENTTAIRNLTIAIEKASSGNGGFIDKTKTPVKSGFKVGI